MSDIFNDYAKIAIEQGLIKEASEVSDETNQRFDSLNNDDIKALYGVKPNGEEEHILDQAHPESVVVSPAYDKMNGLVENLFVRQEIMAWIATKPNDGKHTNERYVKASQDLTMALLNTAFMLDKTNKKSLMKLADSCADRLTKVGEPLTIGLMIGGAVLLAAWGLINNFGGMLDNGVLSNSERAIEELQDLINDQELPGKEEDIQNLITDIEYVKRLNENLRAFNIDADGDELTIKREVENGRKLLKQYIKGVGYLRKRINYILSIASAQENTGKDSSWFVRTFGDLGVTLKKTFELWWSNDIKDALVILETLRDSLGESVASMSTLYNAIVSKAKAGEHQAVEDLIGVKINDKEEVDEDKSISEMLQSTDNS